MPASAQPPLRNAAAGLSARRVQQIVRAEPERREANPAGDCLLMQIARLAAARVIVAARAVDATAKRNGGQAIEKAENGEIGDFAAATGQ